MTTGIVLMGFLAMGAEEDAGIFIAFMAIIFGIFCYPVPIITLITMMRRQARVAYGVLPPSALDH